MPNRADADVDARLALAIVDAPDGSPPSGDSALLLNQLQSVRSIRLAFESLDTAPARRLKPPPFESWGPFVLEEEVGRGGFGVVCRGFDAVVDREIAVKLFSGEDLPPEPRHMARVRHPNVVTVFGAAVHDGRPGIWMEFIHGRTLGERVQSEGPVPPERAIRIGIELCGALSAVHDAQLIHQDIKPRNVMEEHGGRIVLMDFGAGLPQEPHTSPQNFSGTPLYMAPEVILGERPSVQSDVYSLGVLLYYLLTGTYPVYAPKMQELRSLHERALKQPSSRRFMAGLRELRPEVSRAFAECVSKALAPARQRYRTAAELGAALERVRRGRPKVWFAAGWAAAAAIIMGIGWIASRRPVPVALLGLPAPVADATAVAQGLPAVKDVPAAPAAADAPYQVDADLFVRGSAGERRLRSGQRVHVGDELVLRFSGSRALHVYVVSKDEEGRSSLLYPLPDCQPQNPLAGERSHTLPGRCGGRKTAWKIDSAGGREHFLVMAAPRRLTRVEEKLTSLEAPAWVEGETARGVGQRVPMDEASGAAVQFAELIDLAESEVKPKSQAQGLWVHEIILENPAPAP